MTILTLVGRCRADTEGTFSLHSLHLTSPSTQQVSSVFGVSALLKRQRSFPLTGQRTILLEMIETLSGVLKAGSFLFDSHSHSRKSKDPAKKQSYCEDCKVWAVSVPLHGHTLYQGVILANKGSCEKSSVSVSILHMTASHSLVGYSCTRQISADI